LTLVQEGAMRGPKPPAVSLGEAERQELDALARQHRTPQQIALRARIILLAAAGENNSQIARRVGVDVATVRLWRGRWLGLGAVPLADLGVAERLEDAPRPGGPCRITAEQVCRITALACAVPAASGRPISQWTGREIADEVRRRGIAETISPRHASRLLKRGICSRSASATG
jgi:putative transposase